MASHGAPRGSGVQPATEQERKKELQKIQDYRALVDSVNTRIREHQYSAETLELTSNLLKLNPEYYTIWNHRRLITQSLLIHRGTKYPQNDANQVANLISDELSFLLPLLRKFPKCYWIWNYRLWLLEKATRHLPTAKARKIWQQELALSGKMLGADSRNFHGWGYRRTIVQALENSELQIEGSSHSLTETEFEYTTKMINSNLSNFSAWHTRSKLIPRLLKEREANHEARRKFLDEELELIQRALWAGSEDQSLWFYHQYLMSTFDPRYAADSMVPDLTAAEKFAYVVQEFDRVQDMLDGAEDCKWIYQSLTDLSVLHKRLTTEWPVQVEVIRNWVDKLLRLDPLRAGRWSDLKSFLEQ